MKLDFKADNDFNIDVSSAGYNTNDIAIIGMSFKLPEANDEKMFWNNLCNGVSSIRDLPDERRKYVEQYLDEISAKKGSYIKCGYLDNITEFDNEKFNVTPQEARLMDPNQRLVLEHAFLAIDDAGYLDKKIYHTNTGVFIGYGDNNEYFDMIGKAMPEYQDYAVAGNLKSIISGRVAYLLDLKGPAVNIDTACSSSLVAIHAACTALSTMECDMAIAGGIKLFILPTTENIVSIGVESKENKVKAFDDSADGTVWGEGVVIFLLKRLIDAKKDKDHIYAVIKSSAVNQDGKSIGITAPNVSAQEKVLISAWSKAGINPETIRYIESHGTGTKLGDPIEIDAINRAFKHFTNKKSFCAIGTLKSNIGHLAECSGAASLLKAILVLNKKVIPKCTNLNTVNSHLNLKDSAVYFNKENINFTNEDEDQPLRCGISAFGFSGTNCHLVLEEYKGENGKKIEKKIKFNRKNYWLINEKKVINTTTNDSIAKQISVIVSEVLGYDNVDIDRNINEYGRDSLTLLKIQNEINKRLGLSLKISDILSFPTINRLAEFISNSNTKNQSNETNTMICKKDIAIIGMALKFPDAETLEEYWNNLIHKKCSIGNFPEERINLIKDYIAKKYGNNAAFEKGAYLKEIDKFDYNYFGISAKDAELMDPNQRLFLETAIKALEDTGYDIEGLKSKNIGVFTGFANNTLYNYAKLIYEEGKKDFNMAIAPNLTSIISGRVAYFMDFKGPSINVDTACSSSLVAVDLACDALVSGKCDMAIAGGVRLDIIPMDEPEKKIGVESANSSVHVFEEISDGTLWGEGVGAVVLKPLDKAELDHDYIYAVIEGRAVNQDGLSLGITTPNSHAQTDLIIKALDDANLSAEDISYIECHGTGTNLGDPIEIEGIQRAFEKYTTKKQFCAISSVKPNIGHLETASGIASLIKAALALEKKVIPPIANFSIPNQRIDFMNSPLYVAKDPIEWKTSNKLRRCGVSSFGFSGTNCHLILREYLNSRAKDIKIKTKFAETRCWYKSNYQSKNYEIPIINADDSLDPVIMNKLAHIFSVNIGLESIDAESGFYQLGGHSISMMNVIADIKNDLGIVISYMEFVENDTLNKLTSFIEYNRSKEKNDIVFPSCIHINNSHKPFDLTDIQMSYLIGRDDSIVMGGVCTHVYIELETEYDIKRLEKSFNKVIQRHPMLRAVMTNTGQQIVLEDVGYFELLYEDISMLSEEEKTNKIKSKSKLMSETVFDAYKWPLFEMFAYKLDDKKSHLFIGIDMLIADGYSLMLIGHDLLTFYENGEAKLPEIGIDMCDYIHTYKQFKQSELYINAKEFWKKKFKTLPDAPSLPLKTNPINIRKPHFVRKTYKFTEDIIDKVKKIAKEYNVSMSTLLCSLYVELLANWANQMRMTINFTSFNRYPFHKDINNVVGDFTSVLLIDTDLESSDDFKERTQHLQKTINIALENRYYDGVEVIRDIALFRNVSATPIAPYVFTSMIFNDIENPWDKIGTMVNGLSQTPQVYLDCQVVCINDSFIINWDYVEELFSTSMIDEMFDEFISEISGLEV